MVGQYLIPFMIHDKKIVDYTYLNGKIYLVKCKYDNNLIYVGSTKMTLEERMERHRYDTKKTISLHDVVCGDWDNWFIELYENYPCYNKNQLVRREGELIRQIATINKNIAGRTYEEYCRDNHDKRVEKDKKYRQNNRDKILEKRKEKITCNICGCEKSKHNLSRHLRTKKCINQLNQD